MEAKEIIFSLSVLFSLFSFKMAQDSDMSIKPSTDTEEEVKVSKQHQTDSLTILMLMALLLMTILTIWLFKHRRFRFVHETGLSIIYGLIVGAVIRYTSVPNSKSTANLNLTTNGTFPDAVVVHVTEINDKDNSTVSKLVRYEFETVVSNAADEALLEKTVTFDPEIFFNVFLPVIIFEAGFSMKRRHFFRNFGAIVTYAFIGTTISCLVVGGMMYGLTRVMNISFDLNDAFFFGAIISATDPVTVLAIFHDLHVDVTLYALVFGESVLNDAVAIVLSGSVETYGRNSGEGFSAHAFFKALGNFLAIFSGAFAIGSAIGVMTALLTKYTKIRDFPLLETALFFLMSYASFQASEAAGFTGIVAVLFCGICQAHYTYNNLSEESKTRTKQLFELLNFLAENFVFLYIGVSVFTYEETKWDPWFILAAFFAVIVARVFNVYPLSFLLNLGRRNKIKRSVMHMMMFSGLRGAIAYALAIRDTSSEARRLMLSATMVIVLVTVILCGGFVTPMLQWLQIPVGVDEDHDLTTHGAVRDAMGRQRQYSTMEVMGQGSPQPPDPQSLSSMEAEQDIQTRSFGKAYLVAKWYKFDRRFLKPLLTNSRPNLMETCPGCCAPLAKMLTTTEQMMQNDLNIQEDDSDTDIIADHGDISIGGSNHGTNASTPSVISPVDKDHMELRDEAHSGDLGLGDKGQPMRLQVNFGSPTGDHV